MTEPRQSTVGLVPAAGYATRLAADGRLGGSKEVVAVARADGHGTRPVIGHLLEAFARAGIERALVIVRPEKRDVRTAVGDGSAYGLRARCLETAPTPSVVHTLARAKTELAGSNVALGFPDILFAPIDAFAPLLARLESTSAEVVLGLFPTEQCLKTDMVATDSRGRAREIVIKQPPRGLRFTWSIAVWRPSFTAFLCEAARAGPQRGELQVGQVLQRAIDQGLSIDTVRFESGSYLDIGTPEDLARARSW